MAMHVSTATNVDGFAMDAAAVFPQFDYIVLDVDGYSVAVGVAKRGEDVDAVKRIGLVLVQRNQEPAF